MTRIHATAFYKSGAQEEWPDVSAEEFRLHVADGRRGVDLLRALWVLDGETPVVVWIWDDVSEGALGAVVLSGSDASGDS